MKSFKSGILITSIGVLLSFLSVVYISCNKAELNPALCQDLICQHGGYCYSDTVSASPRYNTHYCKCPFGYTGDSCSINANQKFIGTWTVHEIVLNSNNHSSINTTNSYTATIVAGSVPSGFFINNFRGSQMFSSVSCVIDSNQMTDGLANHFTITPEFTPVQSPNFHIMGGIGSEPDNTNLSISGEYYTNWENSAYQGGNVPQTDTISFTMSR